MLPRLIRAVGFTSLLAFGASCADEPKGPEGDLDALDEGGKADTMRKPTEHGVAPFSAGMPSEITTEAKFHAWNFTLSGDAQIDATTSYAVQGQRRTDTVMYLYKQNAEGGWGSYIGRNDDYANTTYSQLKKTLGAGTYRVLIKGYAADTRGKFKLTVNCAGDGCVDEDPNACLFGDAYNEMAENPAIEIVNENKIHPDTLATLSPELQDMLLRAVKQSSHTDVTTPAEALSRVDQEEMNIRWVVEPAAQRAFISFEYGAGDNSYGAIFARPSGDLVTSIHDGDYDGCAVKREHCLFPDDWNGLKATTSFERLSSRVITQAAQLSATEQVQAADAFDKVYDGGVTTVQAGLDMADDNQINFMKLKHKATGTVIDAIEFGAGDTSMGVLYYAGTPNRAGVISDLSIQECSFFE